MFNFEACESQSAGKIGQRDGNIYEIFQPGYRNAHALLLELFQKTHIIRPEVADVFDAMFEHHDAFGAETSGETAELLWVVTTILQHDGVHHTAATNLQPAGASANSTTLATADEAFKIILRAGFGEWEVGRAETRAHILAKQPAS